VKSTANKLQIIWVYKVSILCNYVYN
jgi:hypothetical protein